MAGRRCPASQAMAAVELCDGPVAKEEVGEDREPDEDGRKQHVPADQGRNVRAGDAGSRDRGRCQGRQHEPLRAADAEQQPDTRGRCEVNPLEPVERCLRAAARRRVLRRWAAMHSSRIREERGRERELEQRLERRVSLRPVGRRDRPERDERRAGEQLAERRRRSRSRAAFSRPVRMTVIVAAKPSGLSAATKAYGIS